MLVKCGVTTPISDLRPTRRLAGSARPVLRGQGCRVTGGAARDRRLASEHSPSAAELGRSRDTRGTGTATPPTAARAPIGDARHRPAMAPTPDHQEVDLPELDRTPADRRHNGDVDRADGTGEHRPGLPSDPRRTAQTRPPGRRADPPPCAPAACPPKAHLPGKGAYCPGDGSRSSRTEVGTHAPTGSASVSATSARRQKSTFGRRG
jgi:hypothetical protein